MIKTPLKKIERNNYSVALYLFLMLMSYGLAYLYLLSDVNIWESIKTTMHILFALSNVFFLFSWLKDPGYLKKDKNIDFFEIIERFDANHLCPEC